MVDANKLERQAIHEPIHLKPYDPAWPAIFARERDRLAQLAPELLAIEHIGSTAVPGLAAKPVIDSAKPQRSLRTQRFSEIYKVLSVIFVAILYIPNDLWLIEYCPMQNWKMAALRDRIMEHTR